MKEHNQENSVCDPMSSSRVSLRVSGARTHNLKNITVEIPNGKVTVFTGPSGSGKSSLAFDTIFAEGQRQFMEGLSAYSRRFLKQLIKPDVDQVSGIQPTIALDQRISEPNPISTVATITEVSDFLRVLYSRVGVAHCYKCGRPINRQTIEQIRDYIRQLSNKTRFILFSPIVRERRGSHKDVLQRILKSGFTRARIDGDIVEIDAALELDAKKVHTIEAVIDRLILREGEDFDARLMESLKLAVQQSDGLVICSFEKERLQTERGTTRSVWKDMLFSTKYSCPKCGVSYAELEPRSFSFHSPYGTCETCHGEGKVNSLDPELLISDSQLSIEDDALALGRGLAKSSQEIINRLIKDFQTAYPQTINTPIGAWEESIKHDFFFGLHVEDEYVKETVDEACEEELGENSGVTDKQRDLGIFELEEKSDSFPSYSSNSKNDDVKGAGASQAIQRKFDGLISCLERIYSTAKSVRERNFIDGFRRKIVCSNCKGARIRREAQSVTVNDKNLFETMRMTVDEALLWFSQLQFDEFNEGVAKPLITQICNRLEIMRRLRLGYLTLDRPTDSLSGGELQRVRLTTALGNSLSGVCYILDEPTVGLHPRDVERLLDVIFSLRERGNTVLLVEHNEKVIRNSDWMVDVGPGAGDWGGEILAEGSPEQVAAEGCSPTGLYLSGRKSIAVPSKRRKAFKTKAIELEGVETNNLKNVSVSFPLGVMTCVTGVSGSGKSSLVSDTLVPAVQKRLHNSSGPNLPFEKELKLKSIRGVKQIEKIVVVDQSPLGRTTRSNPATYSGIFDEVRKVFASSLEAKRRGYKAGRFSFNIAGGRCEDCQGLGVQRVESTILPDIYVPCPSCEGKRFNKATLEVKYQGKSISDVLDMSFEEARTFFANHSTLVRYIDSFIEVGLGYLLLGQSSASLSGGEAQRVKLAAELACGETGCTLYVLDEPTVGLHPLDVEKLLAILNRLVDAGNTVVMVEHSTDMMKASDWIIDLGPEGGANGGQVLACGVPEDFSILEGNDTARCLREALNSCRSSTRLNQ